jgi:hypothetical protein
VVGFTLGHFFFTPGTIPLVTNEIRQRVQLGREVAEPAGHWGLAQPMADVLEYNDELRTEMTRLGSLGYAGGTVAARSGGGVTIHDPDGASDELRFFMSGHAPGAELIDPEGRILHRWEKSYKDCIAESGLPADRFQPDPKRVTGCWRRARLLPDGGVLAIYEGHGLVRLDRDSNVLWAYPGTCHHDLDLDAAGNIHVLTRQSRVVDRLHPEKPVLLDFVTVLSPAGEELRRIDLLAAFENSVYAPHLQYRKEAGDIFHTNTLEILDGRSADRLGTDFAAGHYLVSVRELGLIAVVDPAGPEIVWAVSGMWKAQHQPTLLDNGNILLFDNQGQEGRSKVVEFDPLTQDVAWTYADGSGTSLYSHTCGSNQRLPGGNTMITESDNGRALEVTPDGRIVWEFRNPRRIGPEKEYIAAIMDMVVLPAGYTDRWLERTP